MVLIARSAEELKIMIKELGEAGRKASLYMNLQKTKIMSRFCNLHIEIDWKSNILEIVYLSQIISFENKT